MTSAARSATAVEIDRRSDGTLVTLASGDEGNYLGPDELAIVTQALDDAERAGQRWFGLRQRGADFCLGRAPGPSGPDSRELLIGFVQRLQATELVTISAADGGCVGFGVGVFALCDVSLVATSGWFQFPEILHGTAPAIVASWLYDYVPYKQALRWTLTGARFEASDAYTFGLASELVETDELGAALDATIDTIEGIAPPVLHNAKTMGRAMSLVPPHPAVRKDVALKWFLAR
jgi:methylglutaconyl-CoA hydratase